MSLPLSRPNVPSAGPTFEQGLPGPEYTFPPAPPRGFFSEGSGRRPRRKSRFRVSDAATWPLLGRMTAPITSLRHPGRSVTMDLAGSVLALQPACDAHPFRFREEWVSRFLASAPCLLFACSEAHSPPLGFGAIDPAGSGGSSSSLCTSMMSTMCKRPSGSITTAVRCPGGWRIHSG